MSMPAQSDSDFDAMQLDESAVLRTALHALKDKNPPFALGEMLQEWGDEPELLARMLGIFVRDTQMDIDAIALEFAAADHAKLARTAHRLKGAAAALGAEPIREQAAFLENMGRMGQLKDAGNCIGKLRAEFERFKACLSEIPQVQGTP